MTVSADEFLSRFLLQMFFRTRFSASAITAFSAIVIAPNTWPAAGNYWLCAPHPTTDSQLPGPLPATHWDRSAPVPRMPSWHDGAYRRPSRGQARRHLEHLMSSAPILPCLIANLQLTSALRNSCASCASVFGPCSSTCQLRAFSTGPFRFPAARNRPVLCQFHPVDEPRIRSRSRHTPCSLSKHYSLEGFLRLSTLGF